MRLFIAVLFPREVREALAALGEQLRGYAQKGRFVPKDNLHLTLLFLGERPGSQLAVVTQAMDELASSPFLLHIGEMGRFLRGSGDTWWAGIRQSPPLMALHAGLYAQLAACGISLERRPFSPHVTLARNVTLRDESALIELPEVAVPSFTVTGLSLMKSQLGAGAPVYTELYRQEWGR